MTTHLFGECKGGVPRRFSTIVRRAEELAQDVFVKAYQRLDTFAVRRPMKPWLVQIAISGPPLRGPGSPGDWGSTPAGPPNRLLETLSTIAVNRRGPPPLPHAGLGIQCLNRWPVKC